jgi:hypothetical protein
MTIEGTPSEDLKPFQDAVAALNERHYDALRAILQRYPAILQQQRRVYGLLTEAVYANDLEALRVLLDAGVDINTSQDKDPEGIVVRAAGEGALESVRWLLEHGAGINCEVEGVVRCFALAHAIMDGHFEVVRLLVEHGADVNATWAERNALSFAVDYGYPEIADYLRTHGAVLPGETAPAAPDSEILRHIRRHFGQPRGLSLRAVVPTDPDVVIHVVPLPDRQLLVTEGMSARALTVPPGWDRFIYAELLLALPVDWPLTPEALTDPATAWPVQLVRKVALWPHQAGGCLGHGVTVIANGDPPEPLGPGTRLSCVLALGQIGERGQPTLSDGRTVVFYQLIPLYEEDRDLEQREGIRRLVELLDEHEVSEVLDPHRKSLVDRSLAPR